MPVNTYGGGGASNGNVTVLSGQGYLGHSITDYIGNINTGSSGSNGNVVLATTIPAFNNSNNGNMAVTLSAGVQSGTFIPGVISDGCIYQGYAGGSGNDTTTIAGNYSGTVGYKYFLESPNVNVTGNINLQATSDMHIDALNIMAGSVTFYTSGGYALLAGTNIGTLAQPIPGAVSITAASGILTTVTTANNPATSTPSIVANGTISLVSNSSAPNPVQYSCDQCIYLPNYLVRVSPASFTQAAAIQLP